MSEYVHVASNDAAIMHTPHGNGTRARSIFSRSAFSSNSSTWLHSVLRFFHRQ